MKRRAIKKGVVIVNNNSDSKYLLYVIGDYRLAQQKNTKEGVEMIEKNVLTTG